ncbi:MAG: hypothetical protein AAF215_21180 [Cyanobacteria bacterium P01_A01_bin.123]
MVDYADLQKQLEQAGIQNPDKLLDCQKKFGGRTWRNGAEIITFGIVQEGSYWFVPDGKIQVQASWEEYCSLEDDLEEDNLEEDDEDYSPNILFHIRLRCADINPQDEQLYIDQNCVIYCSGDPINESPEMFFLQIDFLQDFQDLKWDYDKTQEIKQKSIQDIPGALLLPGVSDRYSKLYEDSEYIYCFINDKRKQAWRKISKQTAPAP